MTVFSRLFLVAVLALGATTAHAQMKVGVVDPDLIVPQMPEYAQVQTDIQQLEAQIGATLQAKQDSAVALNNELVALANNATANAEIRQQKQAEFLRLRAELQQGEEQGLRYLSNEEVVRLRPALIRLNRAIQDVAKEMNIDLVMTPVANNAPVLIYANFESDRVFDLTRPVLEKLGIEITEEMEGMEPEGN